MSINTRKYAEGTELTVSYPWGINVGGKAICSDGTVRSLARISETADTFFSIPAAVKVHGKTVSGYVTISTGNGSDVATDDNPSMVKFIAYSYGKNAGELPEGAWIAPDLDHTFEVGDMVAAPGGHVGRIVDIIEKGCGHSSCNNIPCIVVKEKRHSTTTNHKTHRLIKTGRNVDGMYPRTDNDGNTTWYKDELSEYYAAEDGHKVQS